MAHLSHIQIPSFSFQKPKAKPSHVRRSLSPKYCDGRITPGLFLTTAASVLFCYLCCPPQASTREEAARWVEVLKVLQTMEEEESKVGRTRARSVSQRQVTLCLAMHVERYICAGQAAPGTKVRRTQSSCSVCEWMPCHVML